MADQPGTDAGQKPVIILMNPAVRPIPAKADVPAEHTLVLMVAAGQEDVALPAHLLPAAVVLQVQAAVVVLEAEAAEEAQVAHFVIADNAFQAPTLTCQSV